MRNLKKLMAVVITVAMLATMLAVPVLAEEDTDASKLADMGMLNGTNGVTDDYLASQPERYIAAILFLRLQGLEDDAYLFEGISTFSDAATATNADGNTLNQQNQNLLAYLYANQDLGYGGYPDGTFQPFKVMSAKEYYKVLLTAMGYKQGVDFEWADVLTFAEEKGLSAVGGVEDFTINHLAIATMEALKAEDGALAAKLVEDGAITAEAAEAAGVYTAPVTELAVNGITATNLKELMVEFSNAIDKDTLKAKYFQVGGADAAAVALQTDGVTVKVTVPTVDQAPPADYKVKVTTDVKDVDGNALAEAYEETVRVVDYEVPIAQTINLTGPRSFEVIFSEPLDPGAAGSVLVENGIYGASVKALDGSNKLKVTLGADLTDDTNYTVTVKGYKDYAGIQMDATDLNLAYIENKDPVAISLVSATQTTVKIKFNKPTATKLDADYFYHTYSSWKPDTVASDDNQTYTLTFTTYSIPEGTFNLVVKATDGTTKVKDEWGIEMDGNATLSLTVTADKTAPTVTEVKQGDAEDKLVVVFSEDVVTDGKAALEASSFTVYDSDGDEVDVTITVAYDADKFTATLTLSKKLSGATGYTVKVEKVVDKSLSANALTATTMGFTVTDKTDPTVDSATYVVTTAADTAEFIYVQFSEAMDESALNLNNYRLGGAALPDKTTIATFGSAAKIKISLPHGTDVTQVLTYGQLSDVAGNVMDKLSDTITPSAEAKPTITSIKTTALNKLEIKVNKVLTSVVAEGLDVTVSGKTYNPAMVSYTVDKGVTTIVATLVDKTKLANSGAVPTNVIVIADKLKSDTGLYMAGATVNTIADGVAPVVSTVSEVYAAAKVMTIGFDETVTSITDDTLAATDLVVTYDGKALVAGAAEGYTVSTASGKLVITFNKAIAAGKKVTVATKDTVNYLADGTGNKVASFSKEKTVK